MIKTLILASASPQRLALLTQIGLAPTVRPVDIDESPCTGETGIELVKRLARSKATSALTQTNSASGWSPTVSSSEIVLGSDTVVMLGTQIYGKPTGEAHALDMLGSLSGRSRRVITAVCVLCCDQQFETTAITTVTFSQISEAQAKAYWDSGEPCGKAGGYAIQGKAAVFVAQLEGSYSNVVGLPLYETAGLLEQAGIPIV